MHANWRSLLNEWMLVCSGCMRVSMRRRQRMAGRGRRERVSGCRSALRAGPPTCAPRAHCITLAQRLLRIATVCTLLLL